MSDNFQVQVAKQAILEKNMKTYAYELLFRNDPLNNFAPEDLDGNNATAQVLVNSFMTIGLDKLAGGKPVFVNFTQELIEQKMPLLFPKESVIIEVLEDVKPEKNVLKALREMSQKGYTIALDDYIFENDMSEFLKLANIIKIDFLAYSLPEIKEKIQDFPKRILLLAEKIDSEEQFNFAKNNGFNFFIGNIFKNHTLLQVKRFLISTFIFFKF
jgi:c-di-GMP-related signal transduction protein